MALIPSGLLPCPKEGELTPESQCSASKRPTQLSRLADSLRDMEQSFEEAGWKLGHYQGSLGKRMESR